MKLRGYRLLPVLQPVRTTRTNNGGAVPLFPRPPLRRLHPLAFQKMCRDLDISGPGADVYIKSLGIDPRPGTDADDDWWVR